MSILSQIPSDASWSTSSFWHSLAHTFAPFIVLFPTDHRHLFLKTLSTFNVQFPFDKTFNIPHSLNMFHSLSHVLNRPDLFIINCFHLLIANLWNRPDIDSRHFQPLENESFDLAVPHFVDVEAAKCCLLILIEGFLPFVPEAAKTLSRAVPDWELQIEKRIGSFAECGKALNYGEIVKREMREVAVICEIIEGELGLPEKWLFDIDVLWRINEFNLTVKRRKIDYFPLPAYEVMNGEFQVGGRRGRVREQRENGEGKKESAEKGGNEVK
jgi:hypothetical protein